MKNTNKAQVWYPDYAIGLLIFVLFLMIFYAFINNYTLEESKILSDLSMDIKSVSASFLTAGYPYDWNSTNVTRIGLTTNNNRIDPYKIDNMKKMDYTATKNVLGTQFDYAIFFTNKFGKPLSVNSSCMLGKGTDIEFLDSGESSAAYYSSNITDFHVLKSLMGAERTDFYYSNYSPGMTLDDWGDIYTVSGGLDDLMSNITKYHMLFLDDPAFDTNNQDYAPARYSYSSFGIATSFENWVAAGNWLFLAGRINLGEFVDADFGGFCYNGTARNCNNHTYSGWNNVTIEAEDSILGLGVGEELMYDDNSSFMPLDAKNFKDIGRYSDNSSGIATWTFNAGHVYYLPDTWLTGQGGTLTQYPDDLKDAFSAVNATRCLAHTFKNNTYQYMVPTTRFLIYESELVAMDIYLWSE